MRAVAYDTENFSSRRIIVRETPPPRIPAPPITSDPPEHRPAKNLLLPAFTPDAIKRYEQHTRDICGKLVARFADKSGCDAAVDYAQEIPVRVIAVMLGLPEEEGDRFRTWIHEILEVGITRPDVLMKAIGETTKYFQAEVEKRRDAPRDDLISQLTDAKIDGAPITEDHLLGALRLILIAGIDTTWSAIGSCFWHLAQHPADRQRLAAEPALIPTAVEEFLRAYAPVTMAREVIKETTINGCPMKPGQMVLLSFPAANRDPGGVSGRRPRRDRPQGEPPRRLRPWHSPLHRLEPGAHGDHRRAAGMAQAHPGIPPRSVRQGDVVGRHGARPAQAAGAFRTKVAVGAPSSLSEGLIWTTPMPDVALNSPLMHRAHSCWSARCAAVLIAATLVLWAHYGTAVFFEIDRGRHRGVFLERMIPKSCPRPIGDGHRFSDQDHAPKK